MVFVWFADFLGVYAFEGQDVQRILVSDKFSGMPINYDIRYYCTLAHSSQKSCDSSSPRTSQLFFGFALTDATPKQSF